jgi:hypothetical protein
MHINLRIQFADINLKYFEAAPAPFNKEIRKDISIYPSQFLQFRMHISFFTLFGLYVSIILFPLLRNRMHEVKT